MALILYIISATLITIIAMQISKEDLKLLTGKYNYAWRKTNTIALVSGIFILSSIIYDFSQIDIQTIIYIEVISLIITIVWTWGMAKANTQNFLIASVTIFIPIIIVSLEFFVFQIQCFSPFALYGFYYRNNPFGNLFGKNFLILKSEKKTVPSTSSVSAENTIQNEIIKSLPDFSFAGASSNKQKKLPIINVAEEGILPDTNIDVLNSVQQLIDKVGQSGGGCIYFPRGKYLFNKNKKNKAYLQINYSNITLKGETDQDGNLLSELINCNNTLSGDKFPWLSPFFITTGEKIQRSNIFWGIQFKHKKNIITRSDSLADPGSDGTILSPSMTTIITENAAQGERKIKVKDIQKLYNIKYIVIALFNNSDGDLIRDILGTNELRPEWGTALRAGDEIAPSYQDLVEIENIDEINNIVYLKQPLRRDIKLKYSPEIYAVELLENICITDLAISSKWNGLFRHHGFPIYYSIAQSQEMDYGWNGINMKRVAHGKIHNVKFKNFTNPLYVMDSRNITVEDILFTGHDGHQGIKVYEHACDNLFKNIEFRCHYADMMGGEGNAYGNVFSDIRYTNPYFKPVDFDFHGFSEGPMSPPAHNLFEQIQGFRYIKSAGALYNQPACAQFNVWWNIQSEGEKKGSPLFVSLPYLPKKGILLKISALRHSFVKCIQQRKISLSALKRNYQTHIQDMYKISIPPKEHAKLYTNSFLCGYRTTANIEYTKNIHIYQFNQNIAPLSLWQYQIKNS